MPDAVFDLGGVLADADEIRRTMREAFPDAAARLAQLDAHLDTVIMLVGHIAEEATR